MEVKNFYDLLAWKKSHILVLSVYRVTKNFPKEERYSVTNQIRRAVTSITANIAEGFARYHYKDKIKFYYYARGSAAEVQNFLLLARDLGYITSTEFTTLGTQSKHSTKLINGLIRSTEKQIETRNR